jgi:hypothetical protein
MVGEEVVKSISWISNLRKGAGEFDPLIGQEDF